MLLVDDIASERVGGAALVWVEPHGATSTRGVSGGSGATAAVSGVRITPGPAASAPKDSLMPMLEKLQGFIRLKRGWDGYRAKPPTAHAIFNAEEFLSSLRVADVEPKRVAPSVVGGVGVTLRAAERKSYVEFYNDGRVYVMHSDGETEPIIYPVRMEQGYEDLISEIRGYLNA